MRNLSDIPSFEDSCTQEILEKKLYTNVFLSQDDKILLGMKKCGFGKGKWNGFGGKVEAGETIEAAAIREMKEEASIDLKNITKVGVLEFVFTGRTTSMEAHIFVASEYTGTITESREMMPKWFDRCMDSLPFDKMWCDDLYWFPYLLEHKNFKGRVYIDGSDEATILGATFELV